MTATMSKTILSFPPPMTICSGIRKEPAMHSEWLAVEHYRIHVMELWPDGPRKEAGLASSRSALAKLVRTMPEGFVWPCAICASRRQNVTMIPCAAMVQSQPSNLAA